MKGSEKFELSINDTGTDDEVSYTMDDAVLSVGTRNHYVANDHTKRRKIVVILRANRYICTRKTFRKIELSI